MSDFNSIHNRLVWFDIPVANLERAIASFERTDGPVMIGRDVTQAIEFQLALGPAGEIVREAGPIAEARRGEIEAALRSELERHAGDRGVHMQSSSWTITARNPG